MSLAPAPTDPSEDLGRFAWRSWWFEGVPATAGPLRAMARATHRLGTTQPVEIIAKPAGRHHNRMPSVNLPIG